MAAAFVLVAASVGAVVEGTGHGSAWPFAPAASPGTPVRGASPGATAGPNASPAASLVAAAAAVLATRGRAVEARDVRAFIATSEPAQAAAARRTFARLGALAWASWHYRVTAASERIEAAGPRTVDVGVVLETRLAHVDPVAGSITEQIVLVQTPRGWRVRAEKSAGARAALWEVGALRVVRGAHSLVVGVGAVSRQTLAVYATATDDAVGAVSAVWGRRWHGPVVVVVPAGTTEVARLLGRPAGDLAQIAAETTDESEASGGADRVLVNRPVMRGLTAIGREVVLRHELLHVAAGAASSTATPLWLEEGLAEYVGYLGSGLPAAVVAADVVAALGHGWRPAGLPADADFDPTDPQLARTYEESWLFARMVAATWGSARLLTLYRSTAAGGRQDAEDNADAAIRRVLGSSRSALEARWRAYLRDVAGSAGSSPA